MNCGACSGRLEMDKALGREVNADKQQRLQQVTGLVSLNPALQDYLGAEYRFAQLMADVQKILADALNEWFKDAGEVLAEDGAVGSRQAKNSCSRPEVPAP